MSFKKKYKIAIGIVLSLAFLLLLGSVVISRVISQKVVQILEDQNVENLHVSIEKTKFSLFDRSLVFNGVHISPDDSAMLQLQKNKLDKKSLHKISISRLKFKGIHLTTLLFSKHLNINKLIIDDPLYQHFTNGEKRSPNKKIKNIELDSIRIEELKGFQLDLIKITNLKVQVIDAISNDISFQNKPLSFEVSGFKLEESATNYFKILPVEDVFEMTRINVEFPKIKYHFSIDALKYHFGDDYLQISTLKYKPTVNKLTLVNSYAFNTEVYDLNIKDIKIFRLDFEKIIENNGFFIDSIQMSQMKMEIYKDKRKPFDLNKRPLLPHQKLKSMKVPLMIHKISLVQSELVYEEKLEHKDVLMKVTMKDLNINLFNITSIKEYRNVPLKNLGTGSSRLLVTGLQNHTGISSVTLIDEVEHGLEPYRILRLLDELGAKSDNTNIIATRSGLVQRDGDVVDVDGVSNVRFQAIEVWKIMLYRCKIKKNEVYKKAMQHGIRVIGELILN